MRGRHLDLHVEVSEFLSLVVTQPAGNFNPGGRRQHRQHTQLALPYCPTQKASVGHVPSRHCGYAGSRPHQPWQVAAEYILACCVWAAGVSCWCQILMLSSLIGIGIGIV